MSVEIILSRLQKVRSTGRDSWMACCPAHEDRGPSLAISLKDDGVILMHCFAQCSTDSVLQAIGLEFDDLFPERERGKSAEYSSHNPYRNRFPARDIIKIIEYEALIVSMGARAIAQGKTITEIDANRISEAASTIALCISAAGLE